MPLLTPILAMDIKKAFDDVEKIGKQDPSADLHMELGKRLAAAIDKYIRAADVVVQTDTPTLSILPGQTTPRGSTITPGKPVLGSTKGTGMGKII